ncbi:MAG: histidinol phosphate phosphatase [Acidimicrobiia bacterium]|nr:histidinol phosphate phosphatase [Acidimicrobiia bacterium]
MTATPAERSLLDRAVAIAREAGELTLSWFRSDRLAVERKRDGTPVTAADREAEFLMRERIAADFPGDAIVGEEHGDTAGTTGRTWYLDPIDGTKAFTHGVPLYTNLIGIWDEHGPLVGVVNMPALAETVHAGRGLGCWCNDVPAQVSSRSTVEGSYLTTSGFDYWPPAALRRVYESNMQMRTWGDGYGYALVATGRVEAMVDPLAAPWDLAPMPVILSEAGGSFTDATGVDTIAGGSGIASNGRFHDAIVALYSG